MSGDINRISQNINTQQTDAAEQKENAQGAVQEEENKAIPTWWGIAANGDSLENSSRLVDDGTVFAPESQAQLGNVDVEDLTKALNQPNTIDDIVKHRNEASEDAINNLKD
jgi:hypothetical protein